MTCANLCFDKDPDGFCSDIEIDTDFVQNGMVTNISVSMKNASNFDAIGNVAIYCIPVNVDLTFGQPQLISFFGDTNLIEDQLVPAGATSAPFTFAWTPTNVQPGSDDAQIAIFVQAIVVATAVGPGQCPGVWHREDFDPGRPYNGAQLFPFAAGLALLAV